MTFFEIIFPLTIHLIMFVLGMYIITRGGYGWLALELFRQIIHG